MTVYLGRKERVYGIPAYIAICDLLHRRHIAGASVLLGCGRRRPRTAAPCALLRANANVPMMIIAVGSGERIGGVLPELAELIRRPMLTLERLRVCKRDGELLERPHALPGVDEQVCRCSRS